MQELLVSRCCEWWEQFRVFSPLFIVLSFFLFTYQRLLIKHLCQSLSVGLSLCFHVLIYRSISAGCAISPRVSPRHQVKLNQTTTLPKAPLTCFNSWPNFSWPAEEMWSVVDHPPSWAMCWENTSRACAGTQMHRSEMYIELAALLLMTSKRSYVIRIPRRRVN